MKKTITSLALVAASLMAVSAHAGNAISITGDVHGGNGISFRGQDMSNDEFSLGLKLRATHDSGAYASLNSDLVKIKQWDHSKINEDGRQTLNQITLGYDHKLGDATIGAGFTRNAFQGGNDVNKLSFSEVFVKGDWNGFHGKLSRVVTGADKNFGNGNEKGDTYAELGYTHHIDKFSLGADLGYSWHKANQSQTDGHQFTQLRAGYAVNDNLAVQLSHQFDSGKGSAKDTTQVKVSYSF